MMLSKLLIFLFLASFLTESSVTARTLSSDTAFLDSLALKLKNHHKNENRDLSDSQNISSPLLPNKHTRDQDRLLMLLKKQDLSWSKITG
ncbi:Uncharacterised protein r2_g2960 [Pycnogonum litorale]